MSVIIAQYPSAAIAEKPSPVSRAENTAAFSIDFKF